MNIDILERKAKLIGYLLGECREHFRLFAEPVPMRLLSAKYGKAMGAVGGFREVMQELSIDGTVTIIRKKTGGQSVLLNGMQQPAGGVRHAG